MALKPKNRDIGEVCCPLCQAPSPVRKNGGGQLYYVCPVHGMHTPRDSGWLLENAVLWPGGEKPETAPEAPAPRVPEKIASATPIDCPEAGAGDDSEPEPEPEPEPDNDIDFWGDW